MRAASWRQNVLASLVFGAAIAFGVLFNTTTSWLVTDCALALLGVSLLSLAWPLFALRAQQLDAHQAADQPLAFRVRRAALIFDLRLSVAKSPLPLVRHVATLPAGHLARGIHHQLPVVVRANAPLALLTKASRLRLQAPLVIGPARAPQLSADVAAALTAFHQAQALTAATSGEFESLRPYRLGDPLNTVNWKLTAAQGTMLRQTFRDAHPTTWWGAFYGADSRGFEAALAVFTTLATRHLWTESYYLGASAATDLTWAQLALLQPVASPAPLTCPPGVNLIVIAGPEIDGTEIRRQYPGHQLVIVHVDSARFWLDTGGQGDG